jgi:predicted PurR-regulated permease PerM
MGREEATVPALPRKFILVGLAIPVAVWLLREALAPFFCAMVAAYLLAPLVERLSRRMNRTWATLLVLAATLGLLALLAWALLPVLAGQAQRLVEGLPALKQGLWHRLEPWLRSHPELLVRLQRGLEGLDLAPLLHGLRLAGAGLLGLFLRLVSLILVPVILYYLLVDGPRILAWIDRAVPARHRDRVRRLAGTLSARLGGYIRGQLAVATVMSPLQGAAFALLGVPHAWLLGIVAGFSNLVPYTPYVTALPAALILAGAAGAGGPRLCLIAAAFTLVQKAEALYFTPVWVGRASHLHPLAVLLAVVVFGSTFGLPGLVFAVPLMILLTVAAEALMQEYRAHPWFAPEAEAPGGAGESSEPAAPPS